MTQKSGHIRIGQIYVGVGGWTFAPWRGTFYPQGLPHAKELAFASERLTSIEVNGTFYRTQTPATFRKWASEVPAGFVFALKGPRFAVNRRVLSEAGDSIKRFLDSGISELGDHLGPLLWQFAPTKKFDAADFGGFLELLPRTFDGRPLRHVIEVRHDSFRTAEFISLLRKFAMRGCNRVKTMCPPLIRRRRSMPGPAACAHGRKATRRTTCRGSMRRTSPRRSRARYSPMSFTKAKSARPRAPWR
jgi:uncharacterized protein YecE (DUF72 family)